MPLFFSPRFYSLYYKLGASSQLEFWNAGILEKWVLGYWTVGLMIIIGSTIKLKMDNIPLLTTIPSFLYSTIP